MLEFGVNSLKNTPVRRSYNTLCEACFPTNVLSETHPIIRANGSFGWLLKGSGRISWTPKAMEDLLFPLWCGLWFGNKVVKGVLQSWCFAEGIRILLGEE
jgi:hypothetical protein